MGESILVPITYGNEELETVTIVDLLRRANLDVLLAGESEMVTMSRGIRIVPDIMLSEIADNECFRAIVIPGGQGVNKLIDNIQLVELVKYNIDKGNLIGAICAAPLFLTSNKLIDESTAITSFPDVRIELNHNNYIEEDVVVSGHIVTSRGVGTAITFSLKLIEILVDKETSDKIAKDICYKC